MYSNQDIDVLFVFVPKSGCENILKYRQNFDLFATLRFYHILPEKGTLNIKEDCGLFTELTLFLGFEVDNAVFHNQENGEYEEHYTQ